MEQAIELSVLRSGLAVWPVRNDEICQWSTGSTIRRPTLEDYPAGQSFIQKTVRCNTWRTYRISGLLNKKLCEPDHLGIVVESLGEVNHLIACVLLVTVAPCSQQTGEGSLRDRVALRSTPCGELMVF